MARTARTTTHEDLVAIFTAGINAAREADPGHAADGGTCNLDKPAIKLHGLRYSTVERAAEAAGVCIYKFTWGGTSWYWVDVELEGQGDRRSTMSSAAVRAMQDEIERTGRAEEWDCMEYKAMD